MNVWHVRVWCGPKQTARTFAFIAACCVNAWFCNLAHPHAPFFPRIIHGNDDNDSVLIVAGWIHETGVGVVLALDEQRVRLYCCTCARIWWYYWCSTRFVDLISPSWCAVKMQYNNGNDGSALMICEQIIVRLACTAACAHKFDGAISWRLVQYEVAISPSCAILLSKYYQLTCRCVGPGPTVRTFYYCVRAQIWRCYCSVIMS